MAREALGLSATGSKAITMTHHVSPAVWGLLPALLLLCGPSPAWAQLRVEAQLSSQELASIQPVELTLSAVSSDGSPGNPDLSVLERDFQILDRRVERRVSVTNGERREEVRLRLALLPRRTGELELPGIAFGSSRTQPLRLNVKGGGSATQAETPALPSPLLLDPGMLEPPGMPAPSAVYPDYYPDWAPGLLASPGPALAPFAPPFIDPGFEAAPPRRPDAAVSALPKSPAEPSANAQGTVGNPWFWVSLALAVTLAVVLRRRREPANAPRWNRGTGSIGEEKVPPDPLEAAVETVRSAYLRGDGNEAREALLHWGRLRWPQDPPGNLARLARRCPPPLRDHITQLEKAFFSPDPIRWERDPVPEELSAQSPTKAEEAAAA